MRLVRVWPCAFSPFALHAQLRPSPLSLSHHSRRARRSQKSEMRKRRGTTRLSIILSVLWVLFEGSLLLTYEFVNLARETAII